MMKYTMKKTLIASALAMTFGLQMATAGTCSDYSILGGTGISAADSRGTANGGACTISLSDNMVAKLDKINKLETEVKNGKDGIDALSEGAVMYDGTTKDKVTLNQNGGGSVLTNVKDGSVATGSLDAVNGGQLFDVKTTADKAATDAATAQATANTASTKADAAKAAADAADAKAVAADGKATAARTTADKAVADAAKAQSTANTANTKADAAKAAADAADAKAVAADGKATAAQTTADKATADAAKAQSTANTASTKADAAKAAADAADAKAVAADGKATAAQTTADKATADAAKAQNTANTASTKADKNTVDIAALRAADALNVKYDSLAKDKVTLGGADGATVAGVKAGTLAADSTEAVNGAQLFDTNQKVADNSRRITVNEGNITKLGNRTTVIEGKLTDLDGKTDKLGASVAANMGGGAAYNQTTGTVSAPSYTVAGSKHSNVGSAFAAVDGKLTQHGNQITNLDRRVTVNEGDIKSIIKGEKGLVQTDGKTTTIDKTGTSTVINVAGAKGDRVITGVANGTAPTDAVNKGQVDAAIGKLVVNNNGRFDQLSERIDANRKSASQGIAAAMAMDIEYPAQHPGEWATGVGMGTYDGQTSLGVGVNYLSRSGKIKVYGGYGQALTSGSRPAAKVGIGFVF